MAGREVREYTNLTDPKDRKLGKGKDRLDDEDIAFQRMVSKMQEVAGERGGYLHGRGALDSDDLLYLKEQMEAEEDAERLLRRTEKRAFAAFKIISSFWLSPYMDGVRLWVPCMHGIYKLKHNQLVGRSFSSLTNGHKAANLADSSPAVVPLPLRVEPKPKSGIRQQDLLKKVVEIKPKRPRVSSSSSGSQPTTTSSSKKSDEEDKEEHPVSERNKAEDQKKVENPVKSLLGLAYASSDGEDD